MDSSSMDPFTLTPNLLFSQLFFSFYFILKAWTKVRETELWTKICRTHTKNPSLWILILPTRFSTSSPVFCGCLCLNTRTNKKQFSHFTCTYMSVCLRGWQSAHIWTCGKSQMFFQWFMSMNAKKARGWCVLGAAPLDSECFSYLRWNT